MSFNLFPALVLIALIPAVIGLSILANRLARTTGSKSLGSILLCGFFAGLVFLFYLDDAMVSRHDEETVRRLFHVPDDVTIGRVYGANKNPACYNSAAYYKTVVEFTPDQFARYEASVHDRSVWRPANPPHYLPHKSRLQFAGDALAWQQLPEPGWFGKQQGVWKIAGSGVRRGFALCYTLNRVEQQALAPAEADISEFSVTPCNARARAKIPPGGGHVAAALDLDKQQLSVEMTFDSKPDYCNNRVSNYLARSLGIATKVPAVASDTQTFMTSPVREPN